MANTIAGRAARLAGRGLTWSIGAFLLAAGLICARGLWDDRRPSDVAIVLGNSVTREGRPSPRLTARLDEAIRVWNAHLVKAIIVSGGVDPAGTDEAAAMRRYLLARGVPDAAIVADPLGITSWATARNATAIMKAHGWGSAMVISQYFHIARTRLAFAKCGVREIRSAHPAYVEWRDLYSITREVAGYPVYWLRSCSSAPQI
jgi:vancomycin permeability regulator SanA